MKHLMQEWRLFLEKTDNNNTTIINSKEELVKYILNNPEENKTINLDRPKGSEKQFGGEKRVMPFDYGEWPNLINPADNMGWDLIIVPSSNKNEDNLKHVGVVAYKDSAGDRVGNDKIILAHSDVSSEDKKTIEDFFSDIDKFKDAEWY
mgnify:CR=1 FL=1